MEMRDIERSREASKQAHVPDSLARDERCPQRKDACNTHEKARENSPFDVAGEREMK